MIFDTRVLRYRNINFKDKPLLLSFLNLYDFQYLLAIKGFIFIMLKKNVTMVDYI